MLKNLKTLRENASISQKYLADAIGVSQQSINKYENHNIEPDIDTLIRIAVFFDVSVDYLIGHSQIRRKLEPTASYDLNQAEGQLIDAYRQLSDKQRKCISGLIDSYLE